MSDEIMQQRTPFENAWALKRLFDLALPHMPLEELQTIAWGASDYSQQVAGNFATVLEGIGCLVSTDEDAGNLQTKHDLPELLFHAANVMREVSGLQYVAAAAALALSSRGSHAGGKGSMP